MDEPYTDESHTGESFTDEPRTDQPGTDQPGTDEPAPELPGAVAGLLGSSAMSEIDLVAALAALAAGTATTADDVAADLQRLLRSDTSFGRLGDRVYHLPSVLDGTTWTVWVDADDAAEGFVRMHPQLSPLGWWLVAGKLPLQAADGEVLGEIETDGWWIDDDDVDVVLGPDGWLDELAGGWASVAVVDGALRWSPCPELPSATAGQVTLVRAGFDLAAGEEPIELPEILARGERRELRLAGADAPIHAALLADRRPFLDAPIPPAPDLLAAAGLEMRGYMVGERGCDWDAYERWQEFHRLAAVHDLEQDHAQLLVLLLGATGLVAGGQMELFGDEAGRVQAATLLAAALEHGPLATAFWRESMRRDADVASVGRLAEELAALLGSHEVTHGVGNGVGNGVGLAWLRARCADLAGDAPAAVALLESAVGPGCDHAPALVDLAGFAADRGDAATAQRLLVQAGVTARSAEDLGLFEELTEGERLLAEVEPFARHRPPPVARRNDPCPCGSGRKYKVCHQGTERHALEDRGGWLYEKACRFARRRGDDLIDDLVELIAEESDNPRARWTMADLPLLIDLVLHEGGLFSEFLASRGALLPDDEALLGAQWELVDRGVFEVRRVGRDQLDLHDIARGERLRVVNVHSSDRTDTSSVLAGRPLPVGGDHRAYAGFVGVGRHAVPALLEAFDRSDPEEIARCLGRLLAPPRMQNTDGHDLVFHTLRWTVPDALAVDAALRAAGLEADEPVDAEPSPWRLVRDSGNQRDTIVATVRLDGDELVAEVNSDERAAELVELVAATLPGSELVDDETTDLDEALASRAPGDVSPALDPDDPEVQRVMAEFIADYEQQWLDQPVPALGGRSPRGAAADPVGREQLEHLIASFPGPSPTLPGGGMEPDRVRRALGL